MEELNWIVERAIDEAFLKDKYLLNFYKYMENQNAKGKDARNFLDSVEALNVRHVIEELEEYVSGGNKQLLEAYRHIGKTKARKISKYLQQILQDAKKYEDERKPGRKKGSKNKRPRKISNK